MSRILFCVRTLGFLLAVFVFGGAAYAADLSWDKVTGNWMQGGNWDPVGPPVAGDTAIIDNDGTATVDTATGSVDQLIVGKNNTGTLILMGGGTVTSTTIYLGYNAGSTGTVTVDGTGSELKTGSDLSSILYVGYFGTGSLILSGGGQATSTSSIVIGSLATSQGAVTVGSGSTLTATFGTVYVGDLGKGLLAGTGMVMANSGGIGTVVKNTGTLSPGDYAGHIGTLTITGNLDMKDNSTLHIDVNSADNDKVAVSGTATVGAIKVDLSWLNNGNHTILTSSGLSYTDDSAIVLLGGEVIPTAAGTRTAAVTKSVMKGGVGSNDLILNIANAPDNDTLTWTGDAGDGKWNISSINWKDSSDSPITFLNGDAVIFNTTAATTIDIVGSQKTVAQMTVEGNNNLTINGNILGDNNLSTLSATTDGSLTKSGAGTLTLNGDNAFSGVTVNGGTLQVDGSIGASSTTVNSGATLTGTGTVGALTMANGATFRPGSSVAGTSMTVNGNLNMAAGSTLHIAYNGTQFNKVIVNGTANIDTDTLNLKLTGMNLQLHPGDKVTLLAANLLTGNLPPKTGTIGGYSYTLMRDGNNLVLLLGGPLPPPFVTAIPATGGGALIVLAVMLAFAARRLHYRRSPYMQVSAANPNSRGRVGKA